MESPWGPHTWEDGLVSSRCVAPRGKMCFSVAPRGRLLNWFFAYTKHELTMPLSLIIVEHWSVLEVRYAFPRTYPFWYGGYITHCFTSHH
jgi:hypothetical protein